MARNIDNLIKRYKNLTGYENVATYEYQGAGSFYLLPDGRFLNCLQDYGSRGDDHRLIFGATRLEGNDWDKLHRNYKIARLIPESGIALIKNKQKLTYEQKQAIENIGFKIERY